ncbi:MAG: hypothetical protein AB7O24_27200 [Kofleriaceae bacterium]
MAASEVLGDPVVAQLYARAVLAVARADHEIGRDEGARLERRINTRLGWAIGLETLMLADPLDSRELAQQFSDTAAGPFRTVAIDKRKLASMIIQDGLEVCMAKGHVTDREARQLIRFAVALGCTTDQILAISPDLEPWL